MTPEEQIIEMYNDRIKDVCVQKKWVITNRIEVNRNFMGLTIASGILLICMLVLAVHTRDWGNFIIAGIFGITLYHVNFLRIGYWKDWMDLERRCQNRIDQLIFDRDEIKREIKEERGY